MPAACSLDQALMIVRDAFGATPYLVGSAITKADFRDVDIRMILDDAKFDQLFGSDDNYDRQRLPLWSLLTTAISEYLERRTGLTVDFEFQRKSDIRDYDRDKPKQPLAFCRG